MFTVVLRTEQTALLRGREQEQDGAAGRLRQGEELAGSQEDTRHAGGVVSRSVVDFIPGLVGLAESQMVPMAAEDHHLILQVGPGKDGAHIAGFLDLGMDVHLDPAAHLERDGLETRSFRGRKYFIQIHPGRPEQFPAAVLVQPAFHGQFTGIPRLGVIEGQVSFQMAIDTDVPAIARRLRIVQNQASCRSLAECLFELVQPPAIIGHVPSPEKRSIVIPGIVHHRDDDLAPDIHPFIIVPAILRSLDAEAAENILGLGNHHLLPCPGRPDDQVVGVAELDLARSFRHDFPAGRPAGDGHHPEGLDPTATECRLQAQPGQLPFQIIHRNVLIGSHRLPAAEGIGRDGLDPFPEDRLVLLRGILGYSRQTDLPEDVRFGHVLGIRTRSILRDGLSQFFEQLDPIRGIGSVGSLEIHRVTVEQRRPVRPAIAFPHQLRAVLAAIVGLEPVIVRLAQETLGVVDELRGEAFLQPLYQQDGLLPVSSGEIADKRIQRMPVHPPLHRSVDNPDGVVGHFHDGDVDDIHVPMSHRSRDGSGRRPLIPL